MSPERGKFINEILEALEEGKLEAEKELYVVLIYSIILDHLKEPEIAAVTGKGVLKIIEEAKVTSAPGFWIEANEQEFPINNWMIVQKEASSLRRERLLGKGVRRRPALEDIEELAEELMQECKQLNRNTRRHCSFLRRKLIPEELQKREQLL